MSDHTIADALSLMKISGTLACCSGRSIEDCPYDVLYFPAAHEAWTVGWEQADMMLKETPVGA